MATLKYVATLGTGFQKSTISNGGSGYVSGATSIVVADGSVFPATGDFYVGVGDSDPPDFIKICTSRTGNTLTVAAGVVAGSDGNKADGVAVQWVLPPEGLDQLQSERNRVLTVAQFDALAATEYRNGDRIILSDGLYEVVRDGGAWHYLYEGREVSRPPSASWSWDNQTTSTIDSTRGYEYAKFVKTGGTQSTWRYRPQPSTPYSIKVSMLYDATGATLGDGNVDNAAVGIGFRESATGKLVVIYAGLITGGFVSFDKWTNSTTFSASYLRFGGSNGTGNLVPYGRPFGLVHFALFNDNTNISVYQSLDGRHWHQFDIDRAKADFFTTAPDQVAFGAYVNADSSVVALIDWQEGTTEPA